jgi:hypothetical protein
MATVKALYPIGKTQWSKWGDEAREAYNHMRNLGFTHETGVAEANAVQAKHKKKKNIFDVIGDVVDVVEDVAEVVEAVTPVVAIAKTVVKATKGKKKAQ